MKYQGRAAKEIRLNKADVGVGRKKWLKV